MLQLLEICTIILLTLSTAVPGQYPSLVDYISTKDIIGSDVFFEIVEPRELEYTYRLRPAKDFGASFSQRMFGVALVPAQPADGCTKLMNREKLRGHIALMQRGDCSFLTKTINAEMAGAVAAIITEINNHSHEYEYYIEMVHDKTKRDAQIPAGFLLGKNGLAIRTTLQRLKRPYAIVNLPVNLTFTPPEKINHPPWLGW